MAGKTSRYGRSIHRFMTSKMLGQRVAEDDEQEDEQAERQIRDQAIGLIADIAFAFLDQPAGAEQRVAEAEADRRTAPQTGSASRNRRRHSGRSAIGKPLDERPDRHALDEGGGERSAGKADIPDPTQCARLL